MSKISSNTIHFQVLMIIDEAESLYGGSNEEEGRKL